MKSRLAITAISLVVVAMIAAVAVQFMSGSAALREATFQSLRVGTNVWSGYEPLYLARSLGFYDDRSVRFVECSSASEVIRAFRNNTIEVAALTLDEALMLKEDGYDIRVILVTDVSHGGDVILAKKTFSDLSELRGHRVGVEHTALGAYVLTRALQDAGMSTADVNVVPLEVDEIERLFSEDKVDAVVAFEPVRSRLLANGAVTLFDSTQIPGEIVDVLVVRAETIDKQSANLKTLLQGWFSALQHLQEQPEDASKHMAERLKITPAAVLASFKGMKLPELSENLSLLQGGRPKLAETVEKLKSVMVKEKLLRGDIDVSHLFSDVPLKRLNDTEIND